MGLSIDEQKAVERFQQAVVTPSMDKLVILDFWAEWCGPCKAIAPMLDKIAAEYADKGVVLAKLNVDEEGFIASQFQVKSIPTIYAIFQGQPVADLTSARSESQMRQALDQLLSQLPVQAGGAEGGGAPQPDLAELVAMGEQVAADGDAERAVGIFRQIAAMAPDHAGAQSGLIRAHLAAGQVEEAQAAYDALPEDLRADPLMAKAHSALALSGTQVDEGELAALRAAAAERPADMDAQMAFAEAAFAAGQREDAADTLLRMVGTDPEWNEGAAKSKLIQIFDAIGLEDPWVSATRRRLSLLLFG